MGHLPQAPFLVNRVVRFIPPNLPQVRDLTPEGVSTELYRYADELHRHLRMAFEALNLDNNLADLVALAKEEQVPIEVVETPIDFDNNQTLTQIEKWLRLIAWHLGEIRNEQVKPDEIDNTDFVES